MKRVVFLVLIFGLLLMPVQAHAQAFTVPILAYHSICTQEVSDNCVPVQMFRAQTQYLRQAGYQTVTFQDLLRWEMGIGLLPKKPILLTFDDGYHDNYTNAFPMLRQQGMRATVFLIARKVGQKGYLNWDEVRDMAQHGFEFGGHTLTHLDVTKLTSAEQREEIGLCKQEIEAQLGRPVIAFAYPYGQFNDAAEQVVKDSGYRYAVSGRSGHAALFEEPFHLKRVVLSGYVSMAEFKKDLL
ncbi:MAG: polysaccharide deacetylase family protein [Tumebacillaceae bacterium]